MDKKISIIYRILKRKKDWYAQNRYKTQKNDSSFIKDVALYGNLTRT